MADNQDDWVDLPVGKTTQAAPSPQKDLDDWQDIAPKTSLMDKVKNAGETGEAFARGAGSNFFGTGFGDEVTGALDAGLGAADSLVTGSNNFGDDSHMGGVTNFIENYRRARDTNRAQNDASEKAHPAAFGSGELGSTAIGMLATPLGEANLATQGGLYGLGNSRADLAKVAQDIKTGDITNMDNLKEDIGNVGGAALDTTVGAATNLAIGKGLTGVGKVGTKIANTELGQVVQKGANKAADWIKDKAAAQAYKALNPSFKKTIADEVSGQSTKIGNNLLDNDLVQPWTSKSSLAKKVLQSKQDAGKGIQTSLEALDNAAADAGAIEEISKGTIVKSGRGATAEMSPESTQLGFPKSDFNVEEFNKPGFVDVETTTSRPTGKINGPEAAASIRKELGDNVSPRIEKVLSSLEQGGENMGLAETNKTVGELGNLSRKTAQESPLLSEDAKKASGILNRTVDQGAAETAEAVGKPELLEQLKSNSKTYGDMKDAARRIGSPEKLNVLGNLGLAGAGLAGVATGHEKLGALGLLAAGSKAYGRSTGASTLNMLSKTVRAAPQVFGKYAAPLTNALQRGGTSLAVTNYLLHQRDPEYREKMREIQEQEAKENKQ